MGLGCVQGWPLPYCWPGAHLWPSDLLVLCKNKQTKNYHATTRKNNAVLTEGSVVLMNGTSKGFHVTMV